MSKDQGNFGFSKKGWEILFGIISMYKHTIPELAAVVFQQELISPSAVQ